MAFNVDLRHLLRCYLVPSWTRRHTAPMQWDLPIRSINRHGRTNWQKTFGYNRRSKVEAAIGRYKRVIGKTLRSREDVRRVCEVKIAVKALNRMLEFGRPVCVAPLDIHPLRRRSAPTIVGATKPQASSRNDKSFTCLLISAEM